MLKTTLGAELLRSEILESKEVNTIFHESIEDESLNQLLNDDEIHFIKESIKDFIDNTLVPFIKENTSLFLAESAEDVKSKLYAFTTFAIKGYLEELADIEVTLENVIENVEQSLIEEGIDPSSEEAEAILAETVATLFEKAALYALSKGLGAMEVIEEIRKSTLKKVGAGLAAAGALAGAGYLAHKNKDEIEKTVQQIGSTIKQYGEKAKEKGEEVGEEVGEKVKEAGEKTKSAFDILKKRIQSKLG